MEFSERLRQLREKHGYTQKQLANAVHLSKNAICNYEKNVNLPNIETLMLLADIFNVPVDYLLGRSTISFKFDKLNKSFFGKFTIIFFEKRGRRGVAPVQVVSHLCHRIVQWLCVADCKHPCLVWGGSPSNIAPSHGEGVWGFGKDAEIERPKALQDAKPTKRSYRDREFAPLL